MSASCTIFNILKFDEIISATYKKIIVASTLTLKTTYGKTTVITRNIMLLKQHKKNQATNQKHIFSLRYQVLTIIKYKLRLLSYLLIVKT